MKPVTNCPKCKSENIYADQNLWICPECSHEWSATESAEESVISPDESVRDAHGNVLADGDTVVVLKDLKLKGSSNVIKGGTKAKNIRVMDAGDGHDISCRIDGFGSINLKSEFVKKV